MDREISADVCEPRSRTLLDAVLDAYPQWLRVRMAVLAAGREGIEDATERVVAAATGFVRSELSALLARDAEDQRENPLHLLRRASRFANAELSVLGVSPSPRDEFEQRAMPDDTHGVGPLAWADLGTRVHDAGIEWGAWKAATIISRRGKEHP